MAAGRGTTQRGRGGTREEPRVQAQSCARTVIAAASGGEWWRGGQRAAWRAEANSDATDRGTAPAAARGGE